MTRQQILTTSLLAVLLYIAFRKLVAVVGQVVFWGVIKSEVTNEFVVVASVIVVVILGILTLVKGYNHLIESNEVNVKGIIRMIGVVLFLVFLGFMANHFLIQDINEYTDVDIARQTVLRNYSLYKGTLASAPILGLGYFLWRLKKTKN